MDCSPPGSSAHGILQARTLEWVAMPSFRRSFWPRDQTLVSCIAGRFFNIWAIREAHHVCKRQVFSSLAPHLWLRYVCDIHTIAPHFIAFLCIALHGYCVFFTNWRFVAALCWASLPAPLFQQHLLTSCLCHILGILAIFQTFISIIFVMMICDQWSLM